MKRSYAKLVQGAMLLAAAFLSAILIYVLWENVPIAGVRNTVLGLCGGVFTLAGLFSLYQRRQVSVFADELCGILDELIAGRQPEILQPYEDSLTSKVRGKLLQFYDILQEGRLQSQQDKQTLQELVSDISHQVKTPVASLQMLTGILRQHQLSGEKQAEFLDMMAGQISKLDFLLESLIKMSRLETGTFVINMKEAGIYDTIAKAISGIWARAEDKHICLSTECDSSVVVRHDPRWTAEALGNILDNAVKYTPEGGSISVTVRPWQLYTRIDIADTGMGIEQEHYNDIFKRFYRAQEAAAQEGVGLGLYLAQGIIARQKGYISVKSQVGKGTTFSVYLMS